MHRQGKRPGMIRLGLSGVLPLVFLAAIAAVFAAAVSHFEGQRAARFAAEGRPAEAVVADKVIRTEIEPDGDRRTIRELELEFLTSDGTPVAVARGVSRSQFGATERGDVVPLTYLPGDPTQIELDAGSTARTALWAGRIAWLLALLPLGLIALGLRTGAALVRLRERGAPRTVPVEEVRRLRIRVNRRARWALIWQVDGVEGQSWPLSREAKREHAEGDRITVYVLDGRTAWEGDVGTRAEVYGMPA